MHFCYVKINNLTLSLSNIMCKPLPGTPPLPTQTVPKPSLPTQPDQLTICCDDLPKPVSDVSSCVEIQNIKFNSCNHQHIEFDSLLDKSSQLICKKCCCYFRVA